MWRNQISYIAGKNVYGTATLESSGAPGHLSQKNEILSPSWLFIAALFIKAKSWKQPKWIATDEWMVNQTAVSWNTTKQQREQIPDIVKNLDALRGIILSEKKPIRKSHTVWFYLCNIQEMTQL